MTRTFFLISPQETRVYLFTLPDPLFKSMSRCPLTTGHFLPSFILCNVVTGGQASGVTACHNKAVHVRHSSLTQCFPSVLLVFLEAKANLLNHRRRNNKKIQRSTNNFIFKDKLTQNVLSWCSKHSCGGFLFVFWPCCAYFCWCRLVFEVQRRPDAKDSQTESLN